MNYLDKFNITFEEFVDDLVKLVPEDSDLRVYQLAIKSLIINKKDFVRGVFNEHVAIVYGEKLLNRDESFFIEQNFSEVENLSSNASEAYEIIRKLKQFWNTMTDGDKEVVWKYFRVLLLLNKKI